MSTTIIKSRRNRQSAVRELARLVREETNFGGDVVSFLIDMYQGRVPGAAARDRIEAAKVLLDRGFGKAPITVEVQGQVNHLHLGANVDLGRLSADDLNSIEATLEKAIVAGALEEGDELEDYYYDGEDAPDAEEVELE